MRLPNEPSILSSTERKIGRTTNRNGTEVDLYEKKIYYSKNAPLGNASGETVEDIAHSISNLDEIIKIDESSLPPSGNDRYTLPYIYYNLNTSKFELTKVEAVNNTYIKLRVENTTWSPNTKFIFTIQYTKTS